MDNEINTYIINNDSSDSDEATDLENPIIKNAITNITINNEESVRQIITHNNSVQNIIEDSINGWDNKSKETLEKWLESLRNQSFVYQWIIENNNKKSKQILFGIILLSALVGIFTGSKLWISNNTFFLRFSDITIMLINFSISYMTALSQKYIDNRKTEEITNYIMNVDQFIGEIMGIILTNSNNKINAIEFFTSHNEKYMNILIKSPSVEINDLINARKNYDKIMKHKFTI